MNKIFNIITPFKAYESEKGGINIEGMASTSDVDRIGDVILAEAWQKGGLDNYKRNPIILFNHDHNTPIGRASDVKVFPDGLGLKAHISKAAPNKVCELIEDQVLSAFSVGFIVRDAEYVPETDGFKITDAELLEVSVVTVPMNQTATFSVAKSFESDREYEKFKEKFAEDKDQAGRSLSKTKAKASALDKDTPAGAPDSAHGRSKMSDKDNTPNLEAIANKAAEDAAERAMQRAAEKAAQELAKKEAAEKEVAAKKAAEAEMKKELQSAIDAGLKTGAEKLMADFKEELTARNADMEEVVNKYKTELADRAKELEDLRNSKHVFADRRNNKGEMSKWADELMYAHFMGVITGKGWTTDYAKQIQEKAGIDYVSNAPDIDQEVANRIEKEIMRDLKVARLFREIRVNGAATVLPIQLDTGLAEWKINDTAGNLENRNNPTANTYQPGQVILNAYRLVSSTFMDNDIEEQILVNLMPMLVEGVARAHARAVERAILIGDGFSSPNISGLDAYAAAHSAQLDLDDVSVATGDSALLTADMLLGARQSMGKYGISPSELVYIVSQNGYFDLLSDSKFQTLDEVGSDLAVRVTGTLGAVYGTPVVVSEEFPAESAGNAAAFVVNTRNYVIPRLRNILVEQDYEVMNQRRVIVASQSLGFEEILPGDGSGTEPSVKITFTA